MSTGTSWNLEASIKAGKNHPTLPQKYPFNPVAYELLEIRKMSLIHDSDHAAECLDHLQTMLWESGDHTQDDDISSLICMLQSPLFRQLLVLQDSIQELEQVNESQGLEGYDFNFLPELQLESTGLANSAFEPETPQATSLPYESTPEYKDEFEKVIRNAAKGREVETIKLFKPEKQSLGFSVVANPGDPSIYVQDIQPGGIADRHGRLRERDQILAIDGQPLDISHQEAIRILQSAGGLVEIVVARGPVPQATVTPGDQEEQVTDTQKQSTAEVSDMLNTEWTQIEVIDLINDGSGLGFGIIGGRSTGVVVKTILPGGVADVDCRLHSGDHILQIGDVDVRGFGSEQVAQVLRQAGSHVRLIVARPINEPQSVPTQDAPIVPTIQLDQHLEQIMSVLEKQDQMLIENQVELEQQNMVQKGMVEHAEVHQPPFNEEMTPEVEYFDVNLLKDSSQGLGITIAGYVGRDNNPDDLCGIFVKSITPGSAAFQDGQIQVNDQIIEVDGQPLQGFSNHDAVEVLRNTGQVVHLKLARYQHGAKFEKLQMYLAQPQMYVQPPPPVIPAETTTIATPRYELNSLTTQQHSPDAEDAGQMQDDLDGELSPDIEAAIRACWEPIVGDEFEVVVAQLSKFKEGGGLGISLEGTVDVENGVEVRPHHYIRAILPDGPVGVNGRLHGGDELLEVNGKRLLGLNHKEVVGILKELPQNVRLVCARRNALPNENYAEQDGGQFQTPPLDSGVSESVPERLVKSKSDNAISESIAQTNLSSKKSRSLEPLTGLAMWSNEPVVIELRKGDKGLGFSILDYQDPVNPSETVIVIRSLVPGGVAQMDGRLVPGDRLVFVNDVNLENATLDEAVQALKGAQKGLVRIGVAKPLPLAGPIQELPVSDEESEIAAHTVNPQFTSPPMHELDLDLDLEKQKHDYMNLEELENLENSLPADVRRKESLSSASTTSDLDLPEEPKHERGESKDSFYESDKEELSFVSPAPRVSPEKPPLKEKPVIKVKPEVKARPVPLPRKQDSTASATSYENEDAIEEMKAHEELIKQKQIELQSQLPARAELDFSFEYENSGFSVTDVKQMEEADSQDRESPEVFEYENTSLGPLPSYEEAVQGDAEFFNMDDLEAPPVPTRDESSMIIAGQVDENQAVPDSTSDERKAPLPSPRKPSPESKNASKTGPKPPVPPKPKTSLSPHSKGTPEGKDEPPPLPGSSPPPLLNRDEETLKTSPGVSEVIKVAKSTSVESMPRTDYSTAADQLDNSDQKADALDSSFSSDQFNTSDLKTVSASSSSTPRTASPGISPITSPSLMRSFSGPDAFPPSLEKRITLKRSQNNLGISVETTEKGINGCVVKTLTKTGAIYKDGRIQVGDYIMSINNESMRRITNTQARVILRRASLMGSADISINYVTAADGAAHKEAVARRPPESPSTPTMMPSPKSTLSPMTKRSSLSDGSAPSSPLSSPRKSPTHAASTSPKATTPQASPRQKETVVVGSGNQTWGPPRLVELHREPGKTLGISIVGGRVDMFHVTEEHMISGIFIKHVLEDSPAGRNGTLKTGDRILQVDGKDLRNATHDQAVDTIRHASNPVRFVIQSLTDPACPRDLETDNKSVHSYDEGSQQMQQTALAANQNQVVEAPVQTSSPVPMTETSPPAVVKQEEEEVDEFGYNQERIQRRYGDLNGDLLLVDLVRGSSGLGISLAGNKDRNTMSVFVAGIQPDSAAGQDGRIQVGDELLEVNGNVLYGRSHLNASAIIKGLNTPVIKIVLLRREDNLERMAVKPIKVTSPVLSKQEKKTEHLQQTTPTSEPATLSPTPSEEKQPVSPTGSNMLDVIQVISLNKGPSGLGFAIVEESREGRQGIYVRSITFGGVADRDNRLSVGDQILEVQDKTLQDVHYDKAIDILRNSQGTVRLKVRKCNVDGTQYAQNNVQGQVTLPNPPGESTTDVPSPNQVSEPGSLDPLTCPIIPGKEMAITIEKGRTGLGLSIVGGADTLLGAIIIHEVYEDGAAARDGRLWAGDQILEVNHENLREATHDYAIQVLRQTPPTVHMLVFRDDTHVKEEDIYDIFTVELIKKPGKGLGLSIVGKRNDVGVYISDIVKGGAAEADGRLMQGDQILSVNSEDMRNATQEYAAAVLKTTMGKVTLNVGRLKAGSRTSSRKNSNSTGGGLRKSESTASNKSKGGRHSKKGSEDMSHIRVVELSHDANGSLGLSIAGGVGSSLGDTPIMVANLTSGGPAERSRKLKVGDKILSINGVSTDGMNHEQVVSMLKSSNDSITLQVTQGEQTPVSVSGRSSSTRGSTRGSTSGATAEIPAVRTPTPQENNVFDDEESPPQYKTITLERGAEGLGFSIVGGHGSPHGDLPIYVKNVFSKGAASENGQLKRGDQILTVNGSNLEGLTHEEAVNILKNAKGTVIMTVLS